MTGIAGFRDAACRVVRYRNMPREPCPARLAFAYNFLGWRERWQMRRDDDDLLQGIDTWVVWIEWRQAGHARFIGNSTLFVVADASDVVR